MINRSRKSADQVQGRNPEHEGPFTKIAAIAGCLVAIISYLTLAYIASWPPFTHSVPPPPPPTASPSLACATGALTLVGSTAFAPLAQAVANAYNDDCAGAHVTVKAQDSASGLTMLGQAAAQDPGKADSMIDMYDGTGASSALLMAHPVGALIYAIVANSADFHESAISVSELENIFVPPGERGVLAVGRLKGSGSRKALLDGVFHLANWGSVPVSNKTCPPPSGYTACTEDYTWQVLNSVNTIPNAIGYAGYTEFADNRVMYPNVYAVNIGSVAPTVQNVKNGSYSFWVVEHLYTTRQPAAIAADFLDFLPHYIESNPVSDFIPCSGALKKLGADC